MRGTLETDSGSGMAFPTDQALDFAMVICNISLSYRAGKAIAHGRSPADSCRLVKAADVRGPACRPNGAGMARRLLGEHFQAFERDRVSP